MSLTVPAKPRTWPKTALVLAALVVFTVLTCLPAIGGVDVDFSAISRNWRNGANKMLQLLQPDFAFLPRTFMPMLETLQMALVGGAFAVLVSVPLTLWAARPTNPNGVTRRIVRAVINVIRSVPDLVYATILVALTGVGALPGLLTLFLFDIGVIVKLVSEAIDSDKHAYLEAGHAAGATQSQLNRALALPQALPLFWNQWLYALELNVRISAILGIVGAGGIGRLLNERFGFYAYDDVSIIILEILVVVILIEVCSNLLRRRIT
ncbi:MAG: phosphonate ABC transporter, permease protein PhnE [Candidatus Microbacterium stercoravium]